MYNVFSPLQAKLRFLRYMAAVGMLSGYIGVAVPAKADDAVLVPVDELQPKRNPLFNKDDSDDGACQSLDLTRQAYQRRIFGEAHADNRFADYQGMTIASIEFTRIDVFDVADPKEDNPLFRLVNSLNMRTRESALRPQLLFSEGDALDPAAVAETERNLRERKYLADAFIMPVGYCRGGIRLVVVVKDAWTTQPILTGSQAGGQSKSKVGVVEGNFLGTGSEVSAVFTKDDQRNSLAYKFKKNYLWGQPLAVSFGFSDNSDGYVRNAQFGKPFYTDSTLTAFDASLEQLEARLTVDQNDNTLVSYDIRSENKSAYVGIQKSLLSKSVTRLYAGISQVKQSYSRYVGELSLAPDQPTDLTYPWLSLEQKSTDYIVAKNINSIGLVEDLRLGAYWRLTLGYSPARDQAPSAYVMSASYDELFQFTNQYVGVALQFDGVRYSEETPVSEKDYYSATAYFNYRYLMGDQQRIFGAVQYFQTRAAALHQSARVGGLSAVRGYPANYVLGDRLLSGSLEYRYHSHLHIFNIIRVGAAAYVDVAMLQNTHHLAIANEGYDGELLSGVGFGLRIASSKTHVGNVIHIDIAKPIGYKENAGSYQVILSAENTF